MDYTTIAASIEQARADIKAQIDDLRERGDTYSMAPRLLQMVGVALERSLTWAAIAYGIDTDANGEPITVEDEGSGRCVNCDHDDHYGERCDGAYGETACACSWPDAGNFTVVPETAVVKPERKPRKGGTDWPAVFEWVAAAKADGTFSGERLVETFGGNACNWKRECSKLGLTLDAPAVKLPKHAFDQQAARDAVAGPPTGPVKPVSVMPLAATPEPKPRDAGYVSVGQVVAAAGDL